MVTITFNGRNYEYAEIPSSISYTCIIYSKYMVSDAMLSKLEGDFKRTSVPPGYEVWFFNRLFVHQESRGAGIGSFLLERVKAFAKDRKIAVYSHVNPYNERGLEETLRFYEKRGFRRINESEIIFVPES